MKPIYEIHKTERAIVMSLGRNVQMTVSDLSKKIKIARTSVYSGLKKLMSKDLVIKKGSVYFLNKNAFPMQNEQVVVSTSMQIENLMKELLHLKAREVIYSIESDDDLALLIQDRRWFTKWQKEIARRGIVLKGIGSDVGLRLFKNLLNSNEKTILQKRSGSARFVPFEITNKPNFIVFRDSVVFFSRRLNIFERIDNQNIADLCKTILDFVFVTGKGESIR